MDQATQENKDTEAKVAEVVPQSSDADQHKVVAIIGYLFPILFFIPLLSEKKSAFAMYHANQHLILLIAAVIVNILWAIPFIGWFIIGPIGMIGLIVIAILSMISAARGEMKPMPLIGNFTLLK